MEHTLSGDTRAVLGRFLRRKVKMPLMVTGGVAAAALLMGAVSSHHRGKVDPTAPLPMTEVPTDAKVQSLYSKSVSAPFGGTILAISVQPGQEVKKGQPLVRMDTREIQQQLAQARANAASALSEYQQARAGEAAEERGIQQSISVVQSQIRSMRQAAQAQAQQATTQTVENEDGSIQVQTTAPAPAAYDASQEQGLMAQISALNAQLAERRQAWAPTLRQAAEQCSQAQAQVGRLTRLLKQSQQVSPATGVVTEVYAKPGTSVAGGQKLVRIDNPAGYRVVASVDQKTRERIDPGAYLRLKLPSGATTGTVEKIASGVDKKLFDYEVWVKPDTDVKLQPGEKIQVMVPKPMETAMIR